MFMGGELLFLFFVFLIGFAFYFEKRFSEQMRDCTEIICREIRTTLAPRLNAPPSPAQTQFPSASQPAEMNAASSDFSDTYNVPEMEVLEFAEPEGCTRNAQTVSPLKSCSEMPPAWNPAAVQVPASDLPQSSSSASIPPQTAASPQSAVPPASHAPSQAPFQVPFQPPFQAPFPAHSSLPFSPEVSKGWNWFWFGREEIGPDENREFIAASNWLIRFGMLILVLGLGFFVKYSIEQGWIGPEMRILGTTLLGAAMYAAGLYFWRTSLNLFGQALIAGSACILYFSAFGASELYHLIPVWAGFSWGCGITVLLYASALRWNSRLIAVLGTLGAYITPTLFPIFQKDPLGLAIYLAIPTLGILAVRRYKTWILAAYLAFFGTLTHWGNMLDVCFCWENRWLFAAAGVFFIFSFQLIAQRRVRNLTIRPAMPDLILAGLSTLIFGYWLADAASLWENSVVYGFCGRPFMTAALTSGCAVGFLLLAALMKRTDINQPFRGMNCGLALVFTLFACGTGMDVRWTLASMLIFCAAFQFAAHKISSNAAAWLTRIAALLLAVILVPYIIAAYAWCFESLFTHRAFDFFLMNHSGAHGKLFFQYDTCFALAWERLFRFFTPGLTLLVMSIDAYRERKNPRFTGVEAIAGTLALFGILHILAYLTMETNLLTEIYRPEMRHGAISIVWTLSALALLGTGLRLKNILIRTGGLILFALTILKIFFVDLSSLAQIYRISAFILLGILILIAGVIYLKSIKVKKENEEVSV